MFTWKMTSVQSLSNNCRGFLPSLLSSFRLCINYIISFTLSSILSLVWFYLKPLVKIGLRKCTGLCELTRICYKREKGALRSLEVEKCVYSSKRQTVKEIRDQLDDVAKNGHFNSNNTREVVQLVENAVEKICIEKEIDPTIHPECVTALRICFLQIYGYKNLQYTINCLHNIPVDINNLRHVKKLVKLRNSFNTNYPLQSKISWIEFGFNSEDSVSNFRNVGLLGLENLLYFTIKYTKDFQQILNFSKSPNKGFPFGSTGIYLTYVAMNLLNSGRLKAHFYNSHFGTTCLEDFHKVYCYLFCTFGQLWLQTKPKSKNDLRLVKEKLISKLDTELEKNDCILKWIPNF